MPMQALDRRGSLRETLRRAWGARLRRLALVLFAIDAAFIVVEISIEVAQRYWFAGAYRLSLNTDGGIPEIYGYAKVQVLVLVLLVAWRSTHDSALLAWIGIFLYVQLEDAASLHETIGVRLDDVFGLPEFAGLEGHDVGELLWFAMVGPLLLAVLVRGELRNGPGVSDLSRVLFVGATLLAAFAVVVDPLALVAREELGLRGLGVVEDGGELVAQSLVLLAGLAWVTLPGRWERRLGRWGGEEPDRHG
ncbi:MAG TPA: hypothetical protein VFZ83_03135 [Acidimicrobiia bacterium]|nr:hypothetical protein [Acidimicrobiia bacterium]